MRVRNITTFLSILFLWITVIQPINGEISASSDKSKTPATKDLIFRCSSGYAVQKKVYLSDENKKEIQEISPEKDGITYRVPDGEFILFKAIPEEGTINYFWSIKNIEGDFEVLPKHYDENAFLMQPTQEIQEIVVDTRKLIPAVFKTIGEGCKEKHVWIEEADDYGYEVLPEQDGNTYLLPENAAIYFEPVLKEGYQILIWRLNGYEVAQRPDVFYKQNLPENFDLSVTFYKEGDLYTVLFEQPQNAILRCKNKMLSGTPFIDSGSTVDPGDIVIFEVAPMDNPNGKVDVDYWEINGEKITDDFGPYRDNSLQLRVLENISVKVIPMRTEERESITKQSFFVFYDRESNAIKGKSADKTKVSLYTLKGELIASILLDKEADFSFDHICKDHTTYIITDGTHYKKIIAL